MFEAKDTAPASQLTCSKAPSPVLQANKVRLPCLPNRGKFHQLGILKAYIRDVLLISWQNDFANTESNMTLKKNTVRRHWMPITVVPFLIANIAYLTVVTGAFKESRKEPRQVEALPPSQVNPLDRDYLLETSQLETFDALVASFAEEDSPVASQALSLGHLSGSSLGMLTMGRVLSDRRVSKLIAIIKKLPTEAASEKCLQLFEMQLAHHAKIWRGVSGLFKTTEHQVVSVRLNHSYHAVASSVFICTQFCKRAECVELCDRWADAAAKEIEQSGVDPERYLRITGVPLIKVAPDDLFAMNVDCILLYKGGCGTFEKLSSSRTQFPQVGYRDVPTWDSADYRMSELLRVPFLNNTYVEYSSIKKVLREALSHCPEGVHDK